MRGEWVKYGDTNLIFFLDDNGNFLEPEDLRAICAAVYEEAQKESEDETKRTD